MGQAILGTTIPEVEDTELLQFGGYAYVEKLRKGESAEFLMSMAMGDPDNSIEISRGFGQLIENDVGQRLGPESSIILQFFSLKPDVEQASLEDVAFDLSNDNTIPLWAVCFLLKKQKYFLPGALAHKCRNVFEVDGEFVIIEGKPREKKWSVYLASERDSTSFEQEDRIFKEFEP